MNFKRQSRILRLEHELGVLGEMSELLSTPAPGTEEQVLGPKRIWSAIPKGKPDGARGDDTGLSEMKSADSHDVHDRCFTTRKTPTGSTSKF